MQNHQWACLKAYYGPVTRRDDFSMLSQGERWQCLRANIDADRAPSGGAHREFMDQAGQNTRHLAAVIDHLDRVTADSLSPSKGPRRAESKGVFWDSLKLNEDVTKKFVLVLSLVGSAVLASHKLATVPTRATAQNIRKRFKKVAQPLGTCAALCELWSGPMSSQPTNQTPSRDLTASGSSASVAMFTS